MKKIIKMYLAQFMRYSITLLNECILAKPMYNVSLAGP